MGLLVLEAGETMSLAYDVAVVTGNHTAGASSVTG